MPNFIKGIEKSGGQRDPFDRYETPDCVTECLLKRVGLPHYVTEPACGTGRMARCIERAGHQVNATDLQEDGIDFLQMKRRCGSIVTNPPYAGGLAFQFVRHALDICNGPVAMLLRLGFLHSQKRSLFFIKRPPSSVIFVSKRIHFYYADGSRLENQVHEHCWIVWNEAIPGGNQWVPPEELPDA